jgi:hypothetical protein
MNAKAPYVTRGRIVTTQPFGECANSAITFSVLVVVIDLLLQ